MRVRLHRMAAAPAHYRTRAFPPQTVVLAIMTMAAFAVDARPAAEVVRVRAGTNWAAIRMANEAAEQVTARRDLVDARRKLDAAIAADPSYWPAYFTRGELNMLEGKYAAVVADTTSALRGRTWLPASAYLRARANLKLGKLAEGIAEIEHVISLQPKGTTYPSALNSLAWIRATCPNPAFRNGRQAIEYAKRACALTGWQNAADIDTLAAAYAEAGDFESAIRFVEQAIKLGDLSAKSMADLQQHLASFRQRRPIRS
jgi:tetratricopeptide (TPR) repeat protein